MLSESKGDLRVAARITGPGPLRLAPVTNLERMYGPDEAWNARHWDTFDADIVVVDVAARATHALARFDAYLERHATASEVARPVTVTEAMPGTVTARR
jgi:hypothetical protein